MAIQQELLQEMQMLEHKHHHLSSDRQSLQVQLNEIENALNEVNLTNDEVYRVLGGIMLKTNKDKLLEELKTKKKTTEIHINSIEKQEKDIESKISELRTKISSSIDEKKS